MEELAPILLLLVWSVLSAIAGAVRNRRMKKNRPGQNQGSDSHEAGPSLLEQLQEVRKQAQQQMLNEMGLETPEQIALRKAAEQRRIAEEKAARKREEANWSAIESYEREFGTEFGGELRTGDEAGAPLPPLPPQPPIGSVPAGAQPPSRLAKDLVEDLQGGQASLRRAVLLTEILGPPPGLAGPGQAGEPTSRPWR